MKYSLRSLMIAVTLICVLLGGWMGRVEYLRQSAEFHIGEAQKHIEILCKTTGLSEDDVGGIIFAASEDGTRIWLGPPDARFLYRAVENEHTRAVNHHRKVAEEFQRAIDHPWMFVDDSDLKPVPPFSHSNP
jgi:hypothetical protein